MVSGHLYGHPEKIRCIIYSSQIRVRTCGPYRLPEFPPFKYRQGFRTALRISGRNQSPSQNQGLCNQASSRFSAPQPHRCLFILLNSIRKRTVTHILDLKFFLKDLRRTVCLPDHIIEIVEKIIYAFAARQQNFQIPGFPSARISFFKSASGSAPSS